MSTPESIKGLLERIPGSDVWWARWQDATGKRHLKKIGRHGDAIKFLEKKHTEALRGKHLPELLPKPSVTFGQLAQDALKYSREANGARSTAELELKLKIMGPVFDSQPAGGITKQDIQNWLLEQAEARRWSPATRNRYQAAFSLVFRVALDNEKITSNPAAKIKRKPELNERVRYLSKDEERRLTAAIKADWPHYMPAFLIAINTGMRAGEQFTLQWRDVSLEHRYITLAKTKAHRSRHIPLNTAALGAFRQLRAANPKGEYVFFNTDGERLRGPRDWFEPALKKAGISEFTWHCCRHTFASNLVMAGVDIRTVAQLMGHATIQMTMRYAHLAPEHTQAAVDRLVSVKRIGKYLVTGTRKQKHGKGKSYVSRIKQRS
ncbi:MAG TPA: site-specific integrase [Terracidiphilus sp.]|nr:site-specific integrase [Terracidiphilus sp.]